MRMNGGRPLSLKARVMLFVATAIGLSLILIGYLIQNAVSNHFIEQDEEELHVITKAVEDALREANTDHSHFAKTLEQAVSGHHGVYYQVLNQQLDILYFTPPFNYQIDIQTRLPEISHEALESVTWELNGQHYRGLITPVKISGNHYYVVAAIEMDFHMHFLDQFQYTLWLIMAIAAVVILSAAWFGIHQGHLPLHKLTADIASIKADRLDTRIDVHGVPSELVTLVNSFNEMLSRLELSFKRLSNFSDDIAHEIRTPLTNLITQTQVGLNKVRSDVEYQELLYSNLEEQERLAKMVNEMLWLAKSDNGLIEIEPEQLDLRRQIQDLFDYFEVLADEKNIQLNLIGQPVLVNADKSMLRRVISNLLSNALRHSPLGKTIDVAVFSELGEVGFSIKNHGEPIPALHLSKIFDRFYRVDPSRQRQSDGVGLGLAIVKSIVEAHSGRVEVQSNTTETIFSIFFPDKNYL